MRRHGLDAAAQAGTHWGALGRDMHGWQSMRCSFVRVHCKVLDMFSMFAGRVALQVDAGGTPSFSPADHVLYAFAVPACFFCVSCEALQGVAQGSFCHTGDT